MEQLLVTLADVQSEDVATVADVLVDMETTSPRKKTEFNQQTWWFMRENQEFCFFFLMGIIMEYPETCGFSPSDGKIGC